MADPDQLRDVSRHDRVKWSITKMRSNLKKGEKPYLQVDLISFEKPECLKDLKEEVLEFAAREVEKEPEK